MSTAYTKDPQVDRALRHSLQDGRAFAVMSGGGETYLSAYALYFHATTAQIGWLASFPPLLGSLAQLLSVWLGQRLRSRKPIILFGAYFQALLWLPIILLPILFPQHAIILLIILVVLYHGASHLISPQWSSLMGDLVPERRRGRFFARRTRVTSFAGFIALVVAGIILHLSDSLGLTLAGFAGVFLVSGIARLVSAYHLNKMLDPPQVEAAWEWMGLVALWQRIRKSDFVRFSAYHGLMHGVVAIASPFFTVYMLRDLNFTYLQFMANTAASVLIQVLVLATWGRISDVFGNRLSLVTASILIPLLPALWLVSTNFWYLICIQVLGGLGWAGFNLSTGNYVYDLLPPGRRSTYLALHNVFMSACVLLGALLGGYLGTALPTEFTFAGKTFGWLSPLYGVFLLSTVLRIVVVFLFVPHLREVRAVRPMSVSGLMFRVLRFHALQGLMFDFIAPRRRRPGLSSTPKDGE